MSNLVHTYPNTCMYFYTHTSDTQTSGYLLRNRLKETRDKETPEGVDIGHWRCPIKMLEALTLTRVVLSQDKKAGKIWGT